ncbi:MAG: hypothetical protein ACRD5H_11940, partial [Nitrososphaerales archaeon]
SLNNPVPPDMKLVFNGTQYKAGLGSYYGTFLGGTPYSIEVEPSRVLPNASINASRGSEIRVSSRSIIEPHLQDAWMYDEASRNRVDLEKINGTYFKIPEYAVQGEYILTVVAEWNDYQLISGASYHHKIRVSSLERVPSVDEISDVELINRTMDLEEVKALLTIYDEPLISVYRSEEFGVEYNISTTQFAGGPYDPNKRCQSTKVILDYDGYPEYITDSGGSRLELGDEGYIEFLERGGACVFTLINAIPDSLAISRTKELEEVQAFLAKYPSATVWTNRLVVIEVGYGITKSEVTGEPWNYVDVPQSGARLRLQVDKDLDIISVMLECIVQKGTSGSAGAYDITENIVGYLQKEEHCWDDSSLRQPFES